MELRSESTADEDDALVLRSVERRGGPLQTALYGLVVVLLGPIERAFIRIGLSADSATLASLVVALGAGLAAASGNLITAGGLYILAGALDLLDGRIARRTKTTSPRGAALDSIVDRFAEGLVVSGLAWNLRGGSGLLLCLAFLVASMGVSYARARGEGLGVRIDAGLMNRGPRVALFALVMIVEGIFREGAAPTLAFLGALGGLALMTLVTAVFRIVLLLQKLPGPPREIPRKGNRLGVRRIR